LLPGVNQGGVDVQSFLPTKQKSGEFAAGVEWPDEITLLVRVHGALDFYSVHEAKRLLLDQLERRPRRVVIDVGDAFVDSSGIGLLVHVAQRVRMERGDFRLVCDERLAELLRVHRLDELIAIAETAGDAFERLPVRVLRTGEPAHTGDRDSGGRLRRVA
jgi:anti-anti-sigma factor